MVNMIQEMKLDGLESIRLYGDLVDFGNMDWNAFLYGELVDLRHGKELRGLFSVPR
jgi:hypothetical protein